MSKPLRQPHCGDLVGYARKQLWGQRLIDARAPAGRVRCVSPGPAQVMRCLLSLAIDAMLNQTAAVRLSCIYVELARERARFVSACRCARFRGLGSKFRGLSPG